VVILAMNKLDELSELVIVGPLLKFRGKMLDKINVSSSHYSNVYQSAGIRIESRVWNVLYSVKSRVVSRVIRVNKTS